MSSMYGIKTEVPAFDVRALPRKRKPIEDEQPLFLRKVFTMIGSCPPTIGGWSSHGETFVIKDADKFAEEIIPTSFKHSKFSSFVRQLNFYGFRKVRPDSANQSHWWEFRHPFFKRDEPELISKIKKSVHFDAQGQPVYREGDSSTNEAVLAEMETMRSKMAAMENTISNLTSLVHNLLSGKAAVAEPLEEASFKKRKMSSAVFPADVEMVPATPVYSLQLPEEPAKFSQWDEMESNLFNDSALGLSNVHDLMTPAADFDLDTFTEYLSTSADANLTLQSSNFVDVFDQEQAVCVVPPVNVTEAIPMVDASLYGAHPLSHPAAMVGMVDLMARTIGTVASMCQTSHHQQQNLSSSNVCQCSNCQMVTIRCGTDAAGAPTEVQVPAVMYPLVAATFGAVATKYGETLFKPHAGITQDAH